MVASLLVSAVLLGFKLSAVKRLVQVNQRRTELEASLISLQPQVEAEKLAVWLTDVEQDAKHRKDRIAAMDSTAGRVYTTSEAEFLAKGAGMFAAFEASSAGAKQLTNSATVTYSETKLDEETHVLFGRAAAVVRATPQAIAAHVLNFDSRFNQSTTDPTVWVRSEVVENVNAHQMIAFSRIKPGAGLSHRTLLNSTVAKKVEDDPPTYLVVGLPIAQHVKIAPKDEKGAVRAEVCRAFKLTEVAAGITKLEYTFSLNLCGSIPRAIANKIAVPGQLHGAPPERPPHTSTPVLLVCFARTRCLLSRKLWAIRYWCGLVQLQRRQYCNGTFSKFCRSHIVTPRTAESSGSCSWRSWAAIRRIWLAPSASSRAAPRCSATAVSHISVQCSRVCSAPMCKAGRTTMRRPFHLHR